MKTEIARQIFGRLPNTKLHETSSSILELFHGHGQMDDAISIRASQGRERK